MPRILRNLIINEVSGVDRGAGKGVKIMLMKRDHPGGGTEIVRKVIKQAEMPISTPATACMGFDTYCEVLAKKDGITKSAAINKALGDLTGRALYQMGRSASAADVLKLGDGELPNGRIDGSSGRASPLHDSYGPDIPTPPTARRPHPLDYSVDRYQHEDEDSGESDDEGHRLAAEAYDAMDQDVSKWMRQDRSLTKSKALDRFRTTYPNAWKMAMRYKPAKPSSNRPLV
jgi:hypothetical protein